jgi:XamI restriction endonuclease
MTVSPPRWTAEQLEVSRLASVTQFREERMQEPLEILTDPSLLAALRYLAGPPISEDDLKTLAEASLAPSRLRNDPAMAQRVIETVLIGLDRQRFPWVVEGREPDASEREAAALASAALMATHCVSTMRRSEGKTRQEETVRDALIGDDFEEVRTRPILTLADAPRAGQFCRESMFGSRKADFIVGLWDGRKMALECKVQGEQ